MKKEKGKQTLALFGCPLLTEEHHHLANIIIAIIVIVVIVLNTIIIIIIIIRFCSYQLRLVYSASFSVFACGSLLGRIKHPGL